MSNFKHLIYFFILFFQYFGQYNFKQIFLSLKETENQSIFKNPIKSLSLIEEPSSEDLSKNIRNFDVQMKKNDVNPLDKLSETPKNQEISDENTKNSIEKEQNMIRNQQKPNYDTNNNIIGGEEEKNINNTTESDNNKNKQPQEETPIVKPIKTDDINENGEEKQKIFHLDNTIGEKKKEDENDKSLSSFFSILFIAILCTFSLVIISIRNFLQKCFELYLLNSLKNILMDIMIIISVITTIELCYYHTLFDSLIESIDIYGICLGFSMFAIIWFIIGATYTVIFQFYINDWNETEMMFNKQDLLLNDYKKFYDEIQEELLNNRKVSYWKKRDLELKKEKIEYFLIRQSFLAPSYLPIVGESFLRDDFNFSEYLGRVISDTFTRTFMFSISSFLFVLMFIYFWTLFTIIPNNSAKIFFMIIFPYVTSMFIYAFKRRVDFIYNMISYRVKEPADNYIANFNQKRNPLIDFIQPIPLYLELDHKILEGQIQNSLLGGIKIPNKHEKLFPLASPLFTVKCMNFCLLSLTIWLVASYAHLIKSIQDDAAGTIFFIIANILTVICYFYYIPLIIKKLAIVSKIAMLKDQKIIQEVNMNYRNLVTSKFAKLYRLFKSIRKQFINQEENIELERGFNEVLENQMKVIKDQVNEYFNVLDKTNNNSIDLSNLPKLARLCGRELEKDELVFLAREASPNGQVINKIDFLKAIFLMAEDVKLDPFTVSKEILLDLSKMDNSSSENGNYSEEMNLNDFRNFLQDQKLLEKEDINIILNEIFYISDNGKTFNIDKLACLIRDSIEGLSR